MQNQTVQTDRNSGVFAYLLFLTGFFLLLEISFFIQCNRTYLSDFAFVSGYLHIPLTILPGVIYFLLAQIGIHLGFCICVWFITICICDLFSCTSAVKLKRGLTIWAIGVATIFVANQVYYPNSKFAVLTTSIFLNQAFSKILLLFLLACCFIFVILSSAAIVRRLWRKKSGMFLLGLGITLALSYFLILHQVLPKPFGTSEKPNIIIIGMDSLRPDFLSYFGSDQVTPFLDQFLSQAAVFGEAVTPLARTFPSWASILTGRYPREIGIRSNLANPKNANLRNTLPAILKQQGYETVFATDETRFSNIDTAFGFDRIITPPIGLNDFLIGTFNDFPLSNLLINSHLGHWLFPYSYANRPVFFSYEPNSFIELIQPFLKQSKTKPVFFAVHFCLTHYPYIWAALPGNDYSMLERYAASVLRIDQQIAELFKLLKQYGYLEHAIVVLLSDHGEALELQGDRITERDLFDAKKLQVVPQFYPSSLDGAAINQSVGHGTDVLGLPQYHTVLAFKLYGLGQEKKRVVNGTVSLLDIKPTILSLLKLPIVDVSGSSLQEIIEGRIDALPLSHHMIESDFTPEAIRTVYPEVRQVLLEGIQLFQIDPHSTRLTVKNSMAQMIIKSKQYADIYGEWMLALYPQNNLTRMPILINLTTGIWTNNLSSDFAQQSPASSMLKALKDFYGEEINQVSS